MKKKTTGMSDEARLEILKCIMREFQKDLQRSGISTFLFLGTSEDLKARQHWLNMAHPIK